MRCLTLNKVFPSPSYGSSDFGATRAPASFALATDNSQDCPLNASRPPRLNRTQVKMLNVRKIRWSHFDIAILYKASYPLREAPSVAQKLCLFTSPFASKRNNDSHIFFATSRTTLFAKLNKRFLTQTRVSQQPCA